MYGWMVHDGQGFISDDIELEESGTMTAAEYDTWWSRFRGTDMTAERDSNGWSVDDFEDVGTHSAYFMAANDALTTAVYSCGVYAFVTDNGVNPDLYSYIFDTRISDDSTELVDHGDDLTYML